MSQVFSGDSVTLVGTPSVPTTTETTVVLGNFLNPPFGNAKAVVFGNLSLTVGAGATGATVRLRRNPAAENLNIGQTGAITVTAGNTVDLSIQAADVIPDGRAVQYALTITQPGATGNGTLNLGNVTTILISG